MYWTTIIVKFQSLESDFQILQIVLPPKKTMISQEKNKPTKYRKKEEFKAENIQGVNQYRKLEHQDLIYIGTNFVFCLNCF